MSDLIQNLRDLANHKNHDLTLADEAADRITELEAENARLKSAAETWHNRNRDNCQRLNDKIAVVGAARESAEQEVARLTVHIRAIAEHHRAESIFNSYHTARIPVVLSILEGK